MERVGNFSALSQEMLHDTYSSPAFQYPNVVFITHTHADHYHEETLRHYLSLWPEAQIIMPHCPFRGGISLEETAYVDGRNTSLHFFPLIHQGNEYANVAHFGLLCTVHHQTLLFTGDGIVADERLQTFLSEKTVDIAILPFPWVTRKSGIAYINQVLKPKHIIINHLPLPGDDVYHYRKISEQTCGAVLSTSDCRMMDSFLKTEII